MKNLLSLLIVSVAVLMAQSSGQIAKELTDENFEHDTQATTGSTIGDWLILFCDFQKMQKCKDYMPFWEELAGDLRGRVTVAFVDM